MSFIAGSVMDGSASLLNDTAKAQYSYTVQIPYLNIALAELQELFLENNIPVTNKRSLVLSVPTGTSSIEFGGTPALPTDLVEIQSLGERDTGTTDSFTDMIRVEFLPMMEVLTTQLIYWSWIGDIIQLLGSTGNRDVKINYIGNIFTDVTAFSDILDIIGGKTYLTYKNAALCAMFIGENPERATVLNSQAELALNRALNIPIKGKQAIITRRRPFMASFRDRGITSY